MHEVLEYGFVLNLLLILVSESILILVIASWFIFRLTNTRNKEVADLVFFFLFTAQFLWIKIDLHGVVDLQPSLLGG